MEGSVIACLSSAASHEVYGLLGRVRGPPAFMLTIRKEAESGLPFLSPISFGRAKEIGSQSGDPDLLCTQLPQQ